MKAYLLVVALAVTAACGKPNDAHVLEHEAKALAKYYQPRLETLGKRLDERVQELQQRGQERVPELRARMDEARSTLDELVALVTASAGQKSALEQNAEAAVKENRILDLRKLVQEAEHALDRGVTIINGTIDTLESFTLQYDRQLVAAADRGVQPTEIEPAPADPSADPAPADPSAEPTPAEPAPADEPAMVPEPAPAR